jgi:HSP20 family protein
MEGIMVDKTQPFGWLPSLYEPFRAATARMADWFAPASEASSDGSAYEVVMELPGVAEADIDVSVHDGVLTIKGEKKSEHEEKGKSFYFSERSYGAFQRSFRLPQDAEEDRIEAQMTDGVLTVKVPKSAPKTPEPKKIAVGRKTG